MKTPTQISLTPTPTLPLAGGGGTPPARQAASRDSLTTRIAGAIDVVVETVAAALLLGTVAIALIQVFCRYVLNDSLSWPEEMA